MVAGKSQRSSHFTLSSIPLVCVAAISQKIRVCAVDVLCSTSLARFMYTKLANREPTEMRLHSEKCKVNAIAAQSIENVVQFGVPQHNCYQLFIIIIIIIIFAFGS